MISQFKYLKFSNQQEYSKKKQEENLSFLNKNSFMMTIVGKPGSGKSSLIEELLLNEELLNNKFEYIIFFSPSELMNIKLIQNQNWFTIFNLQILQNIIDNLIQLIEENKQKVKVLFVFDDMISQIKLYKNNSDFIKFIYNRRHLLPFHTEISLIITTQRYVMIPINFRACLSDIIIFKLNNRDYRFIKEDSVGEININQLNDNILKNDHDFLYINLSEGILYKNFLNKI